MVTIPKDVRKSQFVETEQSEATDYLDLVRNGQNLKIKQSNLVTDFGVTGSLEELGEVTATPILQKVTTINYIRSILGGPGILNEVSPGNGVRLSHNFTPDKSGVPVLYNEGGDSPIIRSITGGTGISVGAAAGEIQISATGTPASTKSIIVYTIDDFPVASGGIITLADNTEYYLVNDITTSNRFIFGSNTVLRGADSILITLTYTGTGIMFTVADKTAKITDCHFNCANGTFITASSTTGNNRLEIFDSRVTCDVIGTFHNLNYLHIYNVNFVDIASDGMLFSGNFDTVLLRVMQATMTTGINDLMDLGTAVFFYWTMDQCFFYVNSTGAVITGLANSGNIDTDGLGVLVNSRQFGTATPLNNISQYDNRWVSALNPHVPDSFDLCLVSHGGTTITIGASATPVIIGATWVNELSHRFTASTGGRFTYTGLGTHCGITASITADIATGIDNCSFFIYKNNVQITNSRITREFDSGNPGNLSLIWDVDLNQNDYIELWAQNDDAAVNIIIVNIVLRIRS